MSLRRTVVARADLLRALECAAGDEDVAERLAMQLGYVRVEPTQEPGTVTGVIVKGDPNRPPEQPSPEPLEQRAGEPLRASFIAITACEVVDEPASAITEPAAARVLTAADCQPRRSGRVPFVPLVRHARLWPALRRSLAVTHAGGIDVRRLVAGMARGEVPLRLPRLARQNWCGDLLVVWDCGERLAPYRRDYRALLDDIAARRGRAGMRFCTVNGVPGRVIDGAATAAGTSARIWHGAVPLPARGARVLLLSDLGLLAEEPGSAAQWRAFAGRLQQAGAQVVAWVPCSARQVEAATAGRMQVHCLDPAGTLRAERGRLHAPEQRAAEIARLQALREDLLTRLACCVRLEAELLRALRGVHPASAAEPALEGLVWSHRPTVRASEVSRPLSPASQPHYRAGFGRLPAAEQRAVLEQMQHVHAWQGRSTGMLEALVWDSHASPEARGEAERGVVAEARAWYAAFQATLREAGTDRAEAAAFAGDVLARNWHDAEFQRQHSGWLAGLWAASGCAAVPSGLHPADVARARGELPGVPAPVHRLLQHGAQLLLWPAGAPAPAAAVSRLGSAWAVHGIELAMATGERRWVELQGQPVTLLVRAHPPEPCEVVAQGLRYRFGAIERPAWAREMGRDRYGLYADVEVATDHGRAVQRLRWIEPGTFLMGSPDDEPERDGNEGPQHPVTLTRGVWLADTACTQALWDAVMGSNPSHFKGDERPVEQVHWRDVQVFLRALERLLPGCAAGLPTEAEWEYACRAGSATPFSFGVQVTPEQVNYNGNVPYVGGAQGQYREQTVAVKSLPANAWGLYEMHGNVLEWCADGLRRYDGQPQTDPQGPAAEGEEALRAVRGGSWTYDTRYVRSACRGASPPGGVYDDQGFRFCLRSIEPGPGRPGGPAGAPAKRARSGSRRPDRDKER